MSAGEKPIRPFGWAAAQLRPYRTRIVIGALLVLGWTGMMAIQPVLVSRAVDEGIARGDVEVTFAWAGAVAGAGLLAYVLRRAQYLVISSVGERFLRDVRVAVFDHIQSLSMGFHDRQRAGALVARMTSDIDAMTTVVQSTLATVVGSVPLGIISLLVLFLLDARLTLLMIAVLIPVAFGARLYSVKAGRAYERVQDRLSDTLAAAQESLSAVAILKATGSTEQMASTVSDRNDALLDANRRQLILSASFYGSIESLGPAMLALVLILAATAGDLASAGTITAFLVGVGNLTSPLQETSYVLQTLQSARAGLVKILGVIAQRPAVAERPRARRLPSVGDLEIERVHFGYSTAKPVIFDVSLNVPQGQRIALVGPTGAGKSTVAKLIARLYDPDEGAVRYGGLDLRDATLATLRERILILPQEAYLFRGSVRDNIRLARPEATDIEVDGALRRLDLSPENLGLNAELDAQGAPLSAGQRQLVSLARVALADPSVLVLDEATSDLDPRTQRAVDAAMSRLVAGRTTIVVAHRLSTAEECDRVVLVDHGRIAEVGTHEQLVARRGKYAELYRRWLEGTTA